MTDQSAEYKLFHADSVPVAGTSPTLTAGLGLLLLGGCLAHPVERDRRTICSSFEDEQHAQSHDDEERGDQSRDQYDEQLCNKAKEYVSTSVKATPIFQQNR